MRLHVIDGTYELFRAHFSKRPDHTGPDGRSYKATVGLASSLLNLLETPSEAVTHLAAAFDNPIRSFRNDLFDGYKTEEGVDPELSAQFDAAEEAVRALGIVVWSMDRWEADDALATAAARFADQVDQVRIMSPDKDLGQCIRGKRVVQVNRLQEKELDEEGLVALRGILPSSIPDLLALVGDTADGIPGVPSVGEKSAAILLGQYGHLEQIPDDPRLWKIKPRGAERIAQSIQQHRQEARLYRTLATTVTDVPLQETLADLEWKGVPRAEFEAWCDKLGVTSLRSRPRRWR